ncbi:MAG: hypothetical protein IT379_02055, partial [Deltaproteobacteria bacterium]|nr:hypothetical protein [Deltaproteobacteria bacterium]
MRRGRSGLSVLLACACACAGVGAAGVARAQETITTNQWAIDVHTGPVLGSGRITGLGGAYTALAEGIDGAAWNPATYASRTPWELSWFEIDFAFGLSFPGAFSDSDFDNNGDVGFSYDDYYFLTLGLRAQFGRVGIGVLARAQLYQVGGGDDPIDVTLTVINGGVGYALFDGQLVLGVATRIATLEIGVPGDDPLVSYGGAVGLELGALLRLVDQRWRLGIAGRTAVAAHDDGTANGTITEDPVTGTRSVAGFVLPREVYLPWELQLGFAFMIGRRPLNVRWRNPRDDDEVFRGNLVRRQRDRLAARTREVQARAVALGRAPTPEDTARWQAEDARWQHDERARRTREEDGLDEEHERLQRARRRWLRNLSRLYLLVSTELLVTGPTSDGIGLESFLSQRIQRSGQDVTLAPRLGLEGEPWPNRIRLRIGSYLEPSRFDDVGYRV